MANESSIFLNNKKILKENYDDYAGMTFLGTDIKEFERDDLMRIISAVVKNGEKLRKALGDYSRLYAMVYREKSVEKQTTKN